MDGCIYGCEGRGKLRTQSRTKHILLGIVVMRSSPEDGRLVDIIQKHEIFRTLLHVKGGADALRELVGAHSTATASDNNQHMNKIMGGRTYSYTLRFRIDSYTLRYRSHSYILRDRRPVPSSPLQKHEVNASVRQLGGAL